MNKKIIAALFLFLAFASFGQTKYVRRSVYFKTDKYDILPSAQKTLDSLAELIHLYDVTSVIVRGNTDSDADSLYNITLSKNRVDAVTGYFSAKAVPAHLFLTKYYGKNNPIASNSTEAGKQINRRADIVVCYKEKQAEKQDSVITIKETPKDECEKDTFITLPDGIAFSMNRCDYLLHKDCMSVKEYIKPESILNSDITTQTSDGEQLESGGMFDFKYCNNAELAHPVTFYVPVPNGGNIYATCGGVVDPKNMSLWKKNPNGTWKQDNSKKLPLVMKNNITYYAVQVLSAGGYNCDHLKGGDGAAFTQNMKFKAKGGLKMKKVALLYRTPTSKYVKTPGWRRNIVKFNNQVCSTCNSEILVSAVAINEKGERLLINARPLSEFKLHRSVSKCNRITGYWLTIFPVRERKLFRKYILYPSDFEIDNNYTKPSATITKN